MKSSRDGPALSFLLKPEGPGGDGVAKHLTPKRDVLQCATFKADLIDNDDMAVKQLVVKRERARPTQLTDFGATDRASSASRGAPPTSPSLI